MEILNYKSKITFKNNSEQNVNSKNTNKISNELNPQPKLAKTPAMGLISFRGYDTMQQIELLRKQTAEIQKIGMKDSLLYWELVTGTPSKKRAQEITEKSTEYELLCKKKSTAPGLKPLLRKLNESASSLNDVDRAIVRDAQKTFDEQTKIPDEFAAEMKSLALETESIWGKAKKENKFSDYENNLAKIMEKTREKAGYISPDSLPYNVLLGNYEPGYTTEKIDKIFGGLREEVVPMVKMVQKKVDKNPELHEFKFLNRPIDIEKAREFCWEVTKDMGFDFDRGQIAYSAHPFTMGVDSNKDARFTLRDPSKQPNFKQATVANLIDMISTTMHECGHALVHQGGGESIYRTGLNGATMGMHESQSRLWENHVGKSKPFWKHYYPKLQEKVPQLKDVKLNDFYRAMNTVKPGLIRTQSDEATYDLHVMLRYDLEKELMDPKTDIKKTVKKLPEKWNQKMEEYLGVTPKTDAEGVLQDIHWSDGSIGYFPSYTLGNIAAAQIFNAAKKQMPDLEKQIENGDLKPLRNWLKEKIHKTGKTYTPDEILVRTTGEELNSKYYTNYLKDKFSKIYDL